jgi:hypothetical protein
MTTCGFLRRLAVAVSLAALALAAGASQSAHASTGCGERLLGRYFLPWLDLAQYTPAPNGGLENGSSGWSLSGGASVVPGNERFFVGAPTDAHSLTLPSGSSATTGTTCVELLDPTLRLFVVNTGSLLSALQVEVLYEDIFGTPRAQTIALLPGTSRWQPTPPILFLANLQAPPLLTDANAAVAFRFTPRGLGDWRIDDVYVDPFKGF